MQLYDVLLVLATARTALGTFQVARPQEGPRPWAAVAQGAAEICCALLLRTWFDKPYRATLGGWIYPVFLYALVWSVVVWFQWMWPLVTGDEPATEEPATRFDAARAAFGDAGYRVVAVFWHALFVAPSLACGAFVIFGLAGELGH